MEDDLPHWKINTHVFAFRAMSTTGHLPLTLRLVVSTHIRPCSPVRATKTDLAGMHGECWERKRSERAERWERLWTDLELRYGTISSRRWRQGWDQAVRGQTPLFCHHAIPSTPVLPGPRLTGNPTFPVAELQTETFLPTSAVPAMEPSTPFRT